MMLGFTQAFICQECLFLWVDSGHDACPNCGASEIGDMFPRQINPSRCRYVVSSEDVIVVGVENQGALKVTPVLLDAQYAMGLLDGLLRTFTESPCFNHENVWKSIENVIHKLQVKANNGIEG